MKKTKIGLAVPGLNYLAASPRALSTLPIVPYLQQEFEVTLIFRKLIDPLTYQSECLTILDPKNLTERERKNHHGYYHPGLLSGLKYVQNLKKFAQETASRFDVILEKEWPFLGSLSQEYQRLGLPTGVITIAEFQKKTATPPALSLRRLKSLGQEVYKQSLPTFRKHWIKKADSIIAESEQMKSFLITQGYTQPNQRVFTIGNGINPEIFYPRDRTACREQLNIPQSAQILVYLGSLNRYIQDPGELIEALGREKPKNVILYIVGDGNKRQELEKIAQEFDSPVIFTGHVPQTQAAVYIGAADLCIAPYNLSLFPQGKFTCSSLKVPEYLACGRPVVTTDCDRMRYLLDQGKYGYLLNHTLADYQTLFKNFPTVAEIQEKEQMLQQDLASSTLSQKQIVITWQEVAQNYAKVIREII